MALFEGTSRIEGSRSNTALVKSGHGSPAEEWLLDPKFKDAALSGVFRDGVLFQYSYGGPGQEDVVIPKGRVVSVSTPVKDFVTKTFKTVLTLPGLAAVRNDVGVVPYNITKDFLQEDRFGGNAPSILTQDYITLPYIPAVEANANFTIAGVLAEETALTVDMKLPWGAVIGAGIVAGDYLKSTPSGRMTKWIKGTDNPIDVVGQILAQDFNSEPHGWMQWVMWDQSAKNEDASFLNRSGSSQLPSDGGWPYDPTYVEGGIDFAGYINQFTSTATGITGLHDGSGNYDGFGKNDTEYTDIALGTAPTVVDGTLMIIQAKDFAGGSLKNLKEGVVVEIAGVAVDAARLAIDYKQGTITLSLLAADATKAITGTYKAFHYGTPSSLDFKGVVGAFNVLLHK